MQENKLTGYKLGGHGAILLTNLLFGINLPAMKIVLHPTLGADWQVISAARIVGAATCFWLLSLFIPYERVEKKDYIKLFLAGLLAVAINQSFTAMGVSLTTPLNTSLVTTLGPIFTLILSAIFLKEPITTKKAFGVAIGLSGAVWLMTLAAQPLMASELPNQDHIRGFLFNLGSSLTYSFYLTIFKPLVDKYKPVTLMKWFFLFSSLVILPFYGKYFIGLEVSGFSPDFYIAISYVVFLGTFAPYLLIPVAQKRIRPTIISMYAYTQPFITALVSISLGQDTWNWWRVPAITLIFLGVYIVTQSKSKSF